MGGKFIPASDMEPDETNSPVEGLAYASSGKPLRSWDFDPGAVAPEAVYFVLPTLGYGSGLTITPIWYSPNTANNVEFGAAIEVHGSAESLLGDGFGAEEQPGAAVVTSTAYGANATVCTPAGAELDGLVAGNFATCRLRVTGGTISGLVSVVGAVVEYTDA